jgi:hypothetical protein
MPIAPRSQEQPNEMSVRRIKLPAAVAAIYRSVAELEAQYPQRKFTPDGHLVGSIGEVIAAEAFRLTLYPMSQKGHDAFDADGPIQTKATAGKSVAMYDCCTRLIVLRIIPPDEAEVVYDGPGEPVWKAAGKKQRNGQHRISLAKIRKIRAEIMAKDDIFGFMAGKGKVEITGDIVGPILTREEWGDLYFEDDPKPKPSPRPRR